MLDKNALTPAWLATGLGTAALTIAMLSFPLAYNAISTLEQDLEMEMLNFKEQADSVWSQIITERSSLANLLQKRQVNDPKCLGGADPMKDAMGQFVRCATTPCPMGYRCTAAEIPYFMVCCKVPERKVDDGCNCNPVNTCPQGPQGPPGNDGAPGIPGEPGEPGSPGSGAEDYRMEAMGCDECPAGPPGNPGVPGPPGAKGEPGQSSVPGTRGQPGSPGPVGKPGNRGQPGNRGSNGRPGAPGQPGIRSRPGPPGSKGRPGSVGGVGGSGSNGRPGDAGRPGSVGKQGDNGTAGRPGNPGIPGPPGIEGQPGNDGEYCPCPSRTSAIRTLLGLNNRVVRIRNNRNRN